MTFRFFPPGISPLKRLFDILVALLLLLLLSPLMIVIACLVVFIDGFPVFYRQARPGYKGKIFQILKFRSMRTRMVDAGGKPIRDEDRITGLGRFLRKTSLDELPEFINVLKGEMSLVGPRPLLVSYLERYSPEQARRHDVLPGISGWAQVNGRNVLTWEDRFRLDVWYVDHWSFELDVRILLKTLWKVLKREGIEASNGGIMEEFKGSSQN